MAAQNVVADIMLEDQIADMWPDYPCLYDVRSPDFKNRDLRESGIQEIAEKVGKTGKRGSYHIFICSNRVKMQLVFTTVLSGLLNCQLPRRNNKRSM